MDAVSGECHTEAAEGEFVFVAKLEHYIEEIDFVARNGFHHALFIHIEHIDDGVVHLLQEAIHIKSDDVVDACGFVGCESIEFFPIDV